MNNRWYIFFPIVFSILLFSCKEDDTYQIPESYDFQNVSYTGQTDRLGMLGEIKDYLETVTDGVSTLEATRLAAMYSNTDATVAGWSGVYGETKQLRSKTEISQQVLFDNLLWDAAEDAASPLASATPGNAGLVTKLDGSKTYYVNENGLEYAQIIEKGLMGACFMYQATAVYLGEERMDVDNSVIEPGEGTAMEHHWDESFGYFGVPVDFPANTAGLQFWGKYCNGRDALLQTNSRIMDAYVTGRAAISNNDLAQRDIQIPLIQEGYDVVSAATAIHYLNAAQSNFNDTATKLHALSEAVAFIYSLSFNPASKSGQETISGMLVDLTGTSDIRNMNLYQVGLAEIQTVKQRISDIYGFNSIQDEL